jgi:tetratricopeptide (TPR) repeat protein
MHSPLGTIAFIASFLCLAPPVLAGFRCPAKGGSQWREYRSAHYVIFTDVGEFKLGRLVAQLESIHTLEVQALVGEQVEIPGRLRVIALADPGLFSDLAGQYEIGGYFKYGFFSDPTIVLPVSGLDVDPEIVAHEVAHHITRFFFVRQPMWFSEGLAEFLQTVAAVEAPLEPRTGSHIVRGQRDHANAIGAVPRHMAQALQEAPRVSFKELFDWDGSADRQGGSYHVYGWLLYHWLWNTRSKDLSAFQQRLSNGDDPADAWRASFPELDPANASAVAKVDEALDAYRKSGRYMSYKVEAKTDASFQKGELVASSDVHMLLHDAANLWDEKERAANIEEALSEDASQPAAIIRHARSIKSSPLEALRKSAAARPNDWQVWLAVAGALPDDAKEEKEAALRKAVALNGDSAQAHNSLAWLLVRQGRPKEALPIANRAVDLMPTSAPMIDTLAAVAAAVGKCSEARVLQRRAVAMAPAGSNLSQELAKKLADYESRCGTAAPAATSAVPPR